MTLDTKIASAREFHKMPGNEPDTREPSMSEPIVLEMYTDYV